MRHSNTQSNTSRATKGKPAVRLAKSDAALHTGASARGRRIEAATTPAPGSRPSAPAPRAASGPAVEASQRALLADPAVIAGVARDESAARPRLANGRFAPRASRPEPPRPRESAVETTGERATTAAAASQPVSTANPSTPIPRTALLDATRAQRLAREARLRERDSREALARARETFEARSSDAIEPSFPTPMRDAREQPTHWRRQPLAAATESALAPSIAAPAAPPGPSPITLGLPASPTIRPALPARESASTPHAAERALLAELREARATLAIARETTQLQREELARLRAELAQTKSVASRAERLAANDTTGSSPSAAQLPTHALQAEIVRLEGRVQSLAGELEQQAAERSRLATTLAANERELAERRRLVDGLNDRIDAQAEALDAARRLADQERRRHSDAQALLTKLRAALAGAAEATGATEAVEPLEAARPERRETRSSVPSAPASQQSAPAPATVTTPATAPATVVVTSSATKRERAFARGPIFEHWQDEQIRSRFGPLGIDSLADLLREPLVRRVGATPASSANSPLTILLVGRSAGSTARSLAEVLLRSGGPAFTLEVADAPPVHTALDRIDDPLADCLHFLDRPDTPSALDALIRARRPALIATRDLLSFENAPEPWLAVLNDAHRAGTALVLVEETGLGPVTPDQEIAAIGQRIFELLPERYTRGDPSQAAVPSFREAFASRPKSPMNGLREALRARFDFELFAEFGFLAEAFVAGSIADCFDPTSARDRRFVKQIAELDERRFESGDVSALHLVARVDPLATR